jgi:hypothetical protein
MRSAKCRIAVATPAQRFQRAVIQVLHFAFFIFCFALPISAADLLFGPEIAFSRIQHGWTNYSTAFLATHDTTSADFGTVAGFYTPQCDVTPLEFAAIFIWGGPTNQQVNFADFTFQVYLWSGLGAFTNSPKLGDLATFTFPRPTGGSTTVPDAFTRGTRPAWLLRFALTNESLVLTNHLTCLVGVAASADSSRAGDLFIPTSRFAGSSDVQAGNTIIGGWRNLADAGGATIYWGQLATELIVRPVLTDPPTLLIEWREGNVQLSWPAQAGCFNVQMSPDLSSSSNWSTLSATADFIDGTNRLTLPATEQTQWFRLCK